MTPSAASSQPAWFGVQANQELRPGGARSAEDIADAVDLRLEPRFRETSGKPPARLDILW
jgi:hypothetical protein